MPVLTIETPSGQQRRVTFDAADATLGRDSRNRLPVDAADLDGVQLRVGLRLCLHDLSERDGILVAGRRVREVTIGPGDTVAIGRAGTTRVRFDCEAVSAATGTVAGDDELARLRQRLAEVLSSGTGDRDELRRALDEAESRRRRAEDAALRVGEELAASEQRYEDLLQALRTTPATDPASVAAVRPAPSSSASTAAAGESTVLRAEIEHERSRMHAAQRVLELEIDDLRRRNRDLTTRLVAAPAAPQTPPASAAPAGAAATDLGEALRGARARIDALAAENRELRSQIELRCRDLEDRAIELARQAQGEAALRREVEEHKQRRREVERAHQEQVDEGNELRRQVAGLDWIERNRAMEQQADRLKAEIAALQAELERTKAEARAWQLKAEQLEASGVVPANGGPAPTQAGDHQWLLRLAKLTPDELLDEAKTSPVVCVAATACQTLLAIERGVDRLREYVVRRFERVIHPDRDNVLSSLELVAHGASGGRRRFLDYVGNRIRNQVSHITLSLYYHIAEEIFERHLKDIRPTKIQNEAKAHAGQKALCWDHYVKKMETINALTFKEQLEDALKEAFRAHIKPGR